MQLKFYSKMKNQLNLKKHNFMVSMIIKLVVQIKKEGKF